MAGPALKAGALAPRTARGFDRLAPVYDALSQLASAGRIHRSQLTLLPLLPRTPRALVVGGGTGRFLVELLRTDRVDRAVSLDASAAMTRRAARRLARLGSELTGRAELRVGGLERLRPGERFDLVVTHCFLDLFEDRELAGVVDRLEAALEPSGLWLFSDFAVDGAGLPAGLRRALVGALYCFFRFTCGISARRLPDFDRAFAQHGLPELAQARLAGGLLRASLHVKLQTDAPGASC